MKEKDYLRAVNNPRHILGIHNYCDRWCERCPLTLRCSVFALGQLEGDKRPPTDGPSLWPRLYALQPVADDLISRHSDHPGVGAPRKPKFDNHDRPVDKHRLGSAAKRYMEYAHAFVEEKQMELPAQTVRAAGVDLSPAEAFDVVNWFHLFITVKLSRALDRDEFGEEMENDPELADMPSDRDGSAKIALLGMDRSILAWTGLYAAIPALRDRVLPPLLTLDRLRKGVEKEFPKARPFERAGFDTLRFPHRDCQQ